MKKFIGINCLLFLLFSCVEQSQYTRTVNAELAKGVRYDSLFLGIHFGISQDSFYNLCFELNEQGTIKEGPHNMTAEYKIPGLEEDIRMNFYPDYHNDKIFRMPVDFHYPKWAPWNKGYFSDKLLPEVIKILEDWYGEGFFEVKSEDGIQLFVKVDGNRRISVRIKDEKLVRATFTDLIAEDEIQEEANK